MSLEADGLSVLAALSQPSQPMNRGVIPRSAKASVGVIFITPAAVSDKLRNVNNQVHALDINMRTNVTRAAVLSTWSEFVSNWQKLFDDHQSTAKILFTGTGSLDRKADEYQDQLRSWYDVLVRENPNAKITVPPPLPPTKPVEPGYFPWWGTSLLTLAGVGALGYLAYAAYRTSQEVGKAKQFAREELVPFALKTGLDQAPDSYTRIHQRVSHRDPLRRDPAIRRDYSEGSWESKHPRHDVTYLPDPAEYMPDPGYEHDE